MALPASGILGIISGPTVTSDRSISNEIDGNETPPKDLATLAATANIVSNISMASFYGYTHAVQPSEPLNVVASNDFPFGINLTWDQPLVGVPTNYRIEMSESGNPYLFYGDSGEDNTYVISDADLSSGGLYQFRVRAENSVGNSLFTESNSLTY